MMLWGRGDGDQREFDLKTRVITNKNIIIPEIFHSCALISRHWGGNQITKESLGIGEIMGCNPKEPEETIVKYLRIHLR